MLYFMFCSWCTLTRQLNKKKYIIKKSNNNIYEKNCYSFVCHM